MAVNRLSTGSDATWCRAWVCDTTAERLALLATFIHPNGPRRGDMILDNEVGQVFIVTNGGSSTQLTGLAVLPIDLTTDVTGVLPVANGGTGLTTDAWVTVPFDAGDFTGSGTITWTVIAGNVTDFSYQILNSNTVVLNIRVEGTTIAGTGIALSIALPSAITPLNGGAGACLVADGTGSLSIGFYSYVGGVPEISFLLITLGNWPTGASAAVYPSAFVYQI